MAWTFAQVALSCQDHIESERLPRGSWTHGANCGVGTHRHCVRCGCEYSKTGGSDRMSSPFLYAFALDGRYRKQLRGQPSSICLHEDWRHSGPIRRRPLTTAAYGPRRTTAGRDEERDGPTSSLSCVRTMVVCQHIAYGTTGRSAHSNWQAYRGLFRHAHVYLPLVPTR